MDCTVLANENLANGFYSITLQPEAPLGDIAPGQFVMVKCGNSTDPLLRRPMSVAGFEADGSRFDILIQVVGRGTALLSQLVQDDHIDVVGPFGNGFEAPDNDEAVWIVAGGVGVAPFVGLLNFNHDTAKRYSIFLGARSDQLLLRKNFFANSGAQLFTATEDGSHGFNGLVTQLLEKQLAETDTRPSLIMTCGPSPMMREVKRIAQAAGIECHASLENRMACGFGACLGCVTKVEGQKRYTTVCRKGPVINAAEVEI